MVDPNSTTGGAGRARTATGSMWDPIAARLGEALLGEFELLGKLGEGGMAAVFLAHEFALNRKVALKVMSPALMMGEGMVDRFRQEAVTQANLQHANIVGVHGVRNVDDVHFFVMQYVMGRTLQDALRSELTAGRYLHVSVVQALIFQVGSALSYAHRRGVIHRDVKPGNILLNGDGDAVVTDFGIAKVAEAPSQTMTGTVVGTPAYMSPEQCFASQLTPASDQYSLGVVAYELITGRTPFQGTAFVLMQAHTTKTPPPFAEFRTDCPPEVEAAVMRMLAKDPDERFDDIGDALHAMGAHAPGVRADDPLRRELQRLADVQGVEASLGDILNAPLSPIPRSKTTGRATAPPDSPRTSAGDPSSTVPTPETRPEATPAPALAQPGGADASAAAPLAGAGRPPASATEVLAGGRDAAASGVAPTRPGVVPTVVSGEAPTAASPDAASPWRKPMLAMTAVLSVVAASLGIWALMRPTAPVLPNAPAATTAEIEASRASVGEPLPPDMARADRASPPPSSTDAAAGAAVEIVGPTSRELEAGQRLTLEARSDRSSGAAPLRWRSTASRIATVDASTGVTEGRTPGTVTIIASQGDRRDSVRVTVMRTAAPAVAENDRATSSRTDTAPSQGAPGSAAQTPSRPAPTEAVVTPPRPPEPSAAAPTVAAPTTPTKSEAELVADAERTIRAYATSIGSRDTAQVRRAFPGVSAQLLRQWQSMYEATERVGATVDRMQPLDNVSVAPGGSCRFQVQQTVSFVVSGTRRSQVQKAEYTATLRRDAAGWTLVGISDR